jgi:hypothetical protein
MCRDPIPDGECCCIRCHSVGFSILFYGGYTPERLDREEYWLPAAGHENRYLVSTFGRVRNRATGRILVSSGRYPSVTLGGRTVAVHRLMGETFLGGPHPGQVVLHDDDCKDHTWITNLRYGTRADNARDASRHGVRRRRCPSGQHRVTPATVYVRSDGVRVCVACIEEARQRDPREWRARRMGVVDAPDDDPECGPQRPAERPSADSRVNTPARPPRQPLDPEAVEDNPERELVWALRLAISRCAGSRDALAETLQEITETHGCTGCIMLRLLDVLACLVEDDEIAVLQDELAVLLDSADR